LSFLHLWPFLWAIAHIFGVPGRFTWPMTLSTCLRGMTKTCHFLHFWPFHELLSRVLCFQGDFQAHDT
jgi:hypothetical protein